MSSSPSTRGSIDYKEGISSSSSRRGITSQDSKGFLQPRSASFCCPIGNEGFSLSKLRFSSLVGLYGRKQELLQLNNAYRDVESTGTKGIVMLSGYTGAGKSSIVNRFRDDIKRTCHQQGKICFFAAGKFDLLNRDEPYTAIISAFTDLIDDIVAIKGDAPELFSRIEDSIVEAVGSEGGVLSSIVPNLIEIIGKEMSTKCDEYDSSMAKNRFNFALLQFIRAVCTETHPMVLFLDDLQWGDIASLDLIETIMKDSQLSHMLLIGCYRENEVDESHPLAICLRGFERDSIPHGGDVGLHVSSIRVDNLDVDTVHALISDVLDASDRQTTLSLARIVHEKTAGNIFYVIQFLTTLRDEGMLVYNLGTQEWKWDADEINASAPAANVVDLLKRRLQKYSRLVLEVLQVASCLGGTFDRSTLVLIVEKLRKSDDGLWADEFLYLKETLPEEGSSQTPPNLDEGLNVCIEEGVLKVVDKSPRRLSFAHDEIQLSALTSIPEDRRGLIQRRIGEVLVEHLSEDELDKNLFVVVDLLNNGYDLFTTDEKRLCLAHLNLRAGKKAMASSAFTSSSAYLDIGIQLLGNNRWKLHYHLSLDLFNTAMTAEYCKGNFEKVYGYADEVTNLTDRPIHHKLSAYGSLIQCLGDRGQPGRALEMCMSVLAQLGHRYDLRFGKLSVLLELMKMKRLFKKYPLSSVINFPVVEEEFKLKEARLLCTCGTLIATVKPDLFPLHILTCAQWSVRNGVSQYTPICLVGYGILDIICYGNLKEANEYGRFALSLSERFQAKEMLSFTTTAYLLNISHWLVPLQIVRKEMIQAYQLALQAGDINHAMMNICFFCCVCYVAGEPLAKLEIDLRKYCKQMESFGQRSIRQLAAVLWQTAMNLMARSENPVFLTGEAMDQETLMRKCADCEASILVFAIKSHQLQLAYLFGHYELAAKLVDKNAAKLNVPNVLVWRHVIFEGLAAFVLARKGETRRKRTAWKNLALQVMRKVRTWVSKGHVNCLHSLHLLEAEMKALEGMRDEAKQKYDPAIATAGRAGFRFDKAISYERAGELFVEVGDSNLATHYLSLAHQQYTEWEASAKADQLLRKHGNLVKKGEPETFMTG